MKPNGIGGNKITLKQYEDDLKQEYYNKPTNANNQPKFMKGYTQPEIIDHIKPQYYFGVKNTTGLERQISLNDSDQDSKGSTSKTPCFIGTPTNGSQMNSLSGTGVMKPEDLLNAMNNSDFQARNKVISSGNSS